MKMNCLKLEGIFFPEDFKSLPFESIIYIKSGKLLVPVKKKVKKKKLK